MNKELLKILYKSNYVVGDINKSKFLFENTIGLMESKRTEQDAHNFLVKNNIPEQQIPDLINKFKEIDKTKNQTLLLPMASAFIEIKDINSIKGVFSEISELINKGRIKRFEKTKRGYILNDDTYENFLSLNEYIHGIQQMGGGEKYLEKVSQKIDVKPIWENNRFVIFAGDSPKTCISLKGSGQLSNKRLPFCIGWYGGNMWQSYRTQKTSTFYYVGDKTKSSDDPLHVVVVDALDPKIAGNLGYNAPFELTDYSNSTGNIAEFGKDVASYIEHLKKNGVPFDELFKHKPKTEEEKMLEQLYNKHPPYNLKDFLNLATTARKMGYQSDLSDAELNYKLQSNWIGLGKRLSDDQFNYLLQHINTKGAYELLKQYVSSGIPLSRDEMNKLVDEADK